MRISEVVIEGVLKPDGTLELAQTPNLLPGRVQVIIRQETESPAPVAENWFQCLLRLRANREADGYPFMNEAQSLLILPGCAKGTVSMTCSRNYPRCQRSRRSLEARLLR